MVLGRQPGLHMFWLCLVILQRWCHVCQRRCQGLRTFFWRRLCWSFFDGLQGSGAETLVSNSTSCKLLCYLSKVSINSIYTSIVCDFEHPHNHQIRSEVRMVCQDSRLVLLFHGRSFPQALMLNPIPVEYALSLHTHSPCIFLWSISAFIFQKKRN